MVHQLENARLLVVMYYSNYHEDYKRFAQGKTEATYYGYQKYILDILLKISCQIEEVAVLSCASEQPYDELIAPGFRAIGAGFNPYRHPKRLVELIEQYRPTHLVIRLPSRQLIGWAARNQVQTLVCLADSFQLNSLRQKLAGFMLAQAMNHPKIGWVSNHGINSCLNLKKMGVHPRKIVPWDFPHVWRGSDSNRTIRTDRSRWSLIYVGAVTELKGVGDLIRAVKVLKDSAFPVKLSIAGEGDLDYFKDLIQKLQIEECVDFLGLVPNHKIVEMMREADVVVVPSQHKYPEGFPLTIYEALNSQTPLVASDHPVFRGKLKNRVNSAVFAAGDHRSLASSIREVLSNPELYGQYSRASYETWKSIQIQVKWGDLISRWLQNSTKDQEWLSQNSLLKGNYVER